MGAQHNVTTDAEKHTTPVRVHCLTIEPHRRSTDGGQFARVDLGRSRSGSMGSSSRSRIEPGAREENLPKGRGVHG
jgi:hypothetical protein